MSNLPIILRLGGRGSKEIRLGCIFVFKTGEVQSLKSVLTSPEATSYWAGWGALHHLKKKFLSPKSVIIMPAATIRPTVITVSATV